MVDLINLMRYFYSTDLFALQVIFLFIHISKNTVPRLVGIYAKNVDERGRNFMCERTLPSLLVPYIL